MMNTTTMKTSRKILISVVVAAGLWIAVKVFLTIGAVLMRRSPGWLTN